MATTKETPKATRITFGPDRCHHRDGKGRPDCTKTRWGRKSGTGYRGNLCEAHERAWMKAAAERYAANHPKPATASLAAPVAAKSKTATNTRPPAKRPARGVVVPLRADDAPLGPIEDADAE